MNFLSLLLLDKVGNNSLQNNFYFNQLLNDWVSRIKV